MIWHGRNDGDDPLYQRIFQRVILGNNFNDISENDFVLQGFAVDEGVKRNKGKSGAAEAPDIIRQQMSNFPITNANFRLFDLGNITCENDNLELAQEKLAVNAEKIVLNKAKSVVLGGGHEVMYAHFSGLRHAFPQKKIGIINIDAHFDNRELNPQIGATSGTGFYQVAQQEEINSLHIGIQKNSNTLKLFDFSHQNKMQYILAEELYFENLPKIYQKIDDFISKVDVFYLTICMDVFNVAIAPGVSAAAYNGIFADATFMHFYKHLLKNQKLLALDVAEVNPKLDLHDRTSRLAASLVNEWFMIS